MKERKPERESPKDSLLSTSDRGGGLPEQKDVGEKKREEGVILTTTAPAGIECKRRRRIRMEEMVLVRAGLDLLLGKNWRHRKK